MYFNELQYSEHGLRYLIPPRMLNNFEVKKTWIATRFPGDIRLEPCAFRKVDAFICYFNKYSIERRVSLSLITSVDLLYKRNSKDAGKQSLQLSSLAWNACSIHCSVPYSSKAKVINRWLSWNSEFHWVELLSCYLFEERYRYREAGKMQPSQTLVWTSNFSETYWHNILTQAQIKEEGLM